MICHQLTILSGLRMLAN